MNLTYLPMPVHLFNEEMDIASKQQIEATIAKSKVKADHFYNQYYRKTLRDATTQSESLEEIYRVFINDIIQLTNQIKHL